MEIFCIGRWADFSSVLPDYRGSESNLSWIKVSATLVENVAYSRQESSFWKVSERQTQSQPLDRSEWPLRPAIVLITPNATRQNQKSTTRPRSMRKGTWRAAGGMYL